MAATQPVDDARTQAIASSVSVLRDRTWKQGFCHYDFHPGKVLFDDRGLSGVVDWDVARAAPFTYDVGWCRCALAIWPGGGAPELFGAHYARLSPRSLDGLAYWDMLAGAIILQRKPNWLAMYHSLGVNISADQLGHGAAAFIDDALARLSA